MVAAGDSLTIGTGKLLAEAAYRPWHAAKKSDSGFGWWARPALGSLDGVEQDLAIVGKHAFQHPLDGVAIRSLAATDERAAP